MHRDRLQQKGGTKGVVWRDLEVGDKPFLAHDVRFPLLMQQSSAQEEDKLSYNSIGPAVHEIILVRCSTSRQVVT